ncbi:MAG: hypothetical protein J6B04_03450 [Clostridia bacterium]|nr:hypothetical protein [Clostridia bacterium]
MTTKINHQNLGEIVYEESFWTGKKSLTVNGRQLQKINKKTFSYAEGDVSNVAVISGNFISGTKLLINGEVVQITPPAKWYEYAMSIAIFVLIMVWGNSVALCSILPVVGGAIGGAISGVFTILNLVLIKKTNNILLKLLISLGFMAITFGICLAIGFAIVLALI